MNMKVHNLCRATANPNHGLEKDGELYTLWYSLYHRLSCAHLAPKLIIVMGVPHCEPFETFDDWNIHLQRENRRRFQGNFRALGHAARDPWPAAESPPRSLRSDMAQDTQFLGHELFSCGGFRIGRFGNVILKARSVSFVVIFPFSSMGRRRFLPTPSSYRYPHGN